jgi:cytochrome c553
MSLPVALCKAVACSLFAISSLTVQAQQRELDYVMGSTKPDPAHGAKLYETCAACHGQRGEGVSDGSVPSIGGQHYLVLVKQLADFRAEVRPEMRMRHFADTKHLAYSQEIADVSAYISRLPAPAPAAAIPGDSLSRGANVYVRSCERCHGPTGEGSGESFVPRIAAQHADYLQRQLDDSRPGRRESMIRSHAQFSAGLSDADRIAVTRYLAGSESFAPGER